MPNDSFMRRGWAHALSDNVLHEQLSRRQVSGLIVLAAAAAGGYDIFHRLSVNLPPLMHEVVNMLYVAAVAVLLAFWFSLRKASLRRSQENTQRALDEERRLLRLLIDNVPDYIYVKDEQSRFVVANRAVADLVGAANPEDLLGKTDFDYFPQDMAASFFADEQAVIRSGKALINREEPCVDAQGQAKWNLTTKVPLLDSGGAAGWDHGHRTRPHVAKKSRSGNRKGTRSSRPSKQNEKHFPRQHES